VSASKSESAAAVRADSSTPIAPWLVTQANSLAALGIPPRRFRELLRELGLPVVELGKLRAVEARVFLEAIRKRVPAPAAPVESNRERLLKIAGLK
jgi:hypothetical protein